MERAATKEEAVAGTSKLEEVIREGASEALGEEM
jgi:hypothetical protein